MLCSSIFCCFLNFSLPFLTSSSATSTDKKLELILSVHLQVITMCMCVTLSASVTLIFLFLPKLYIIVLRPERNNRALFTTSKSIRCHIGARVAAAIVEPPSKQTIYRLSGSRDADLTGNTMKTNISTWSNQTYKIVA